MLHVHHSSSDEEEVGASEVQGHAVLHRELEARFRCLRLCLKLQYRGNWDWLKRMCSLKKESNAHQNQESGEVGEIFRKLL